MFVLLSNFKHLNIYAVAGPATRANILHTKSPAVNALEVASADTV